MEIKMEKGKLLKALGLVTGVSSQKANTLPILSNILIETFSEGLVKFQATDLEVGISTTVEAEVIKEGNITVPSKKLHDIIRELPESEIEITVAKNNAVTIKSGKAYFKIMGLSKDDFPKLPEWSEESAITLEQSVVKESLTLTSFAISNDETRYVLNGVLIIIKDNRICFVATDGRRLAYFEKDLPNEKGKAIEIIVPVKAILELMKIVGWEGDVKVALTQNQVMFRAGETYIVSRIIEGNFPNYEQVIPKDKKTISQANREEILQAIRRIALLTSPDSPAIKMDFLKGKILISSKSPNLGEAKEELSADVEGGDLAIGFNPYYLIDVLKNLDIENVSFALTTPDKPGLVYGKDGYKYVVMPMQIS